MPFQPNEMKVFSGSSNRQLAEKIAKYIGIDLGKCEVERFADGEINIRVDETVRGHDIFIIQPTCPPVNENLMELLVMMDALRRASAKSITAVIPYYGYARQDRKARGRDPITAKLVANLLTISGASRIMTIDLHAEQIQGFFDIPVDNLWGFPIFKRHLEEKTDISKNNLVVVSPDIGGVKRASKFAERLGVPLAILDKRRPKDNIAEIVHVIGEVENRTAVIFDDIIDTGRSLVEAAKMIKNKGANKVYACATHAVLSGKAKQLISDSPIEKVFISDTIHHPELPEKFEVVSIAGLLGEALMRVRKNLSVSILFR
ncbi:MULTISPECIES: ribose-phosphate pyrophosphokinase [Kosmotoga]|jgi:ribose-phosphate pyrophosphokinase|uniref:Ribose-phosphate pyrophosphokinase n=1 Tax=Kosmotoga olearia (strain ATCC BAA-1733 / DSM 21960 / TBF 19.5.1) TaxID=521045 RepID=C5CFS1_KOSOT|nr:MULTISPECIES: ribose-phosphate pyrophosphokinase [Kosmotoga]ACR80419.1 ribose-phosphate pyrophosphokinase [Kosmotoga olearia TBF 19.5.1]MDI3523391.1 ribose-phosphate pyrophosphokinae [Kosmotoga sp.]MDK2952889.1 ribose-phosphate pyrophosphokinae [Kosmotoga sp.]OAA19919.1 ribose-phosphate pyrophosphokinase [Kosmotoga sp. DU53]